MLLHVPKQCEEVSRRLSSEPELKVSVGMTRNLKLALLKRGVAWQAASVHRYPRAKLIFPNHRTADVQS